MIKLSKYDVENWIKTIAGGEFYYRNVLDGQIDPSSYGHLRKIMHEICSAENPICERVGRKDGFYRPIENHAIPLNWQKIARRIDSEVLLPFNLRDYVFIYPDTVIVVAGAKSAGKTGFLYRVIVLNMNHKNVILLTNLEGGLALLKDRFEAMDVEIPDPAPFKVINVSDNFHDYIKERDTLYVIDYIDCPDGESFYLIGAAISKIDRKLQGLNSVAVVGLQKPTMRDTAFGGEQTLKNASLYITLNSGKLKILDAKVPANKNFHPKNMQWTFKYDEAGTNFWDIKRSYEVD